MLGQKVRTLTSGSKVAGTHVLRWDGLDECWKQCIYWNLSLYID